MKIAIIGMGVAGISVLREWTKEKEEDSSIELTVFGDKHTFGTGVPYQEDSKALLMNQPAEFTTIIPEKEDDFVKWLENTQGQKNARLKYVPRKLFGTYLTERMNAWLTQSKAEVIKEQVQMIRVLPNNRLRLTWASGVKDYDAVHLCVGNLPYKDSYHLINHPNFIIDPFPIKKQLSLVPNGAALAVLGTGLTSIDIFRYIYYTRPDVTLSFFSRSGQFKSVRNKSKPIEYRYFTKENIKNAREENSGFIPLSTYIKWFSKELAAQQVSLKNDWMKESFGSKYTIKKELNGNTEVGVVQALLLGMNPLLTDLWMALSETDKQLFFNKYYSKWDKLRSSFPAASGERLVTSWEDKKITVFDNLSDIIQLEKSFKLVLKDQKAQYADYIINATGTEKTISFKIERMPLLHQLLNERILQPETFGGVQAKLPDLSAISQRYGVLRTLKIHGQLITGIQFGNNSVDIISDSARTAVNDLVQYIIKNKE